MREIDRLRTDYLTDQAASSPIRISSARPRITASRSVDAKAAWRDTVFVERFWRSLKCEEGYLRADDSASEAKHFIGAIFRSTTSKVRIRPWTGARRTTYTSIGRPPRRRNPRSHHITKADSVFKTPGPPPTLVVT